MGAPLDDTVGMPGMPELWIVGSRYRWAVLDWFGIRKFSVYQSALCKTLTEQTLYLLSVGSGGTYNCVVYCIKQS